jgi:integrase
MLPEHWTFAMASLTKRTLDAAKPRDKEYFLWCETTPGFGVRVYPSGKRIFIVQVRVGRRQQRHKIGLFGPFTVDQARTRAQAIIREAFEGRDPRLEKQEARDGLTVAALCDLYMEAAQAGLVTTRFRRPKSPSTVMIDEGRIARHIKPLLGRTLARDLSRAVVQRMADDVAKGKTAGRFPGKPRGRAVVTGGATTAARVVELLGGIYTWAERRELVPGPNPVRGVEKAKANSKDRVLDPEELKALGRSIREAEALSPAPSTALRLIALTGLRREEAAAMEWNEIDLAGSCLRLQDTKTGRSMRPLGNAAKELLANLPRTSRWVFPNRTGTASADLKKRIAAIFDAAGLPDARAHDLRRTFASVAADEGYSDATIGELLGHARRGVTARHYIRRPDAALIGAADCVSAHIAKLMSSEEKAEVIAFREKMA